MVLHYTISLGQCKSKFLWSHCANRIVGRAEPYPYRPEKSKDDLNINCTRIHSYNQESDIIQLFQTLDILLVKALPAEVFFNSVSSSFIYQCFLADLSDLLSILKTMEKSLFVWSYHNNNSYTPIVIIIIIIS